jgi:gluconate 2-dehydrogenase gamma chain
MTTRRDTLKVLGAAAMQHHVEPAMPAASYKPAFFTEAEYACVEAMVDRIVPGSRQAAVAQFIDETVKRNEKLHDLYRTGLAPLVAAKFADLPPAAQDAALAKLGEEGRAFWKSIRNLTIDGYYSSKIGLAELGYSGKSFLSEFKGCTHPEHQA